MLWTGKSCKSKHLRLHLLSNQSADQFSVESLRRWVIFRWRTCFAMTVSVWIDPTDDAQLVFKWNRSSSASLSWTFKHFICVCRGLWPFRLSGFRGASTAFRFVFLLVWTFLPDSVKWWFRCERFVLFRRLAVNSKVWEEDRSLCSGYLQEKWKVVYSFMQLAAFNVLKWSFLQRWICCYFLFETLTVCLCDLDLLKNESTHYFLILRCFHLIRHKFRNYGKIIRIFVSLPKLDVQ